MKPISKQEYFEFYNSTGIEIDNRKQMVQEAVDYFEGKISKLVEFAKCIPGFRALPLQDQANLIKCKYIFIRKSPPQSEKRIMAHVYVRSITRNTMYPKAPFC